jgi:hypothetical protein
MHRERGCVVVRVAAFISECKDDLRSVFLEESYQFANHVPQTLRNFAVNDSKTGAPSTVVRFVKCRVKLMTAKCGVRFS